MKGKCAEHLVSELSILKPNVLVFHAADARWSFPAAVEKNKWQLSSDKEAPKYRGGFSALQLLKADDFECHVLFLNFPGHGNLRKQWSSVVEPTIKTLRSQGVIPQ